MVLCPRRPECCPRAMQDLVRAIGQDSGRLCFGLLGLVEMDSPVTRMGEGGEYLAIHERVGGGRVRRAKLNGDVIGEVGRPVRSEIDTTGSGSAAAMSS